MIELRYSSYDGVVLLPTAAHFRGSMVLRVLNKKEPRTQDEQNAATNRMASGFTRTGEYKLRIVPSTFNNLDAPEFSKILAARPSLESLQKAYYCNPADSL